MRFPLRLSAGLSKARVSSVFGSVSAASPIFRFNPCVTHLAAGQRSEEASTDFEWHSPEDCATQVRAISSPVVWVGGTEPLLHPEIGRAANAIVDTDRFVFLHTNGYSLRQRIHEFRPDSRLFLTLEFAGRKEVRSATSGYPDAFCRSIEAIRAAKLSGFLVAAHVTVTKLTDACDVGGLIEFLDKKDVDGFIVTAAGQAASDSSLAETLAHVRAMIRGSRWEDFSKLLEASYAKAAPVPACNHYATGSENAFEEGD
ncbi:MAG: radical SAM protein [Acidobacteria bacterium]|nr:radical SAM protein [Acidobacteriota bacterium]MBS1865237.1 radical SAM protein [Acidobacteriota bacterium]